MFKVIFLLVFLPSYTLASHQQVSPSMIDQCNKTFPIETSLLHTDDVTELFNVMKVDKNGKCFVHCFLQKANLVDPEGSIQKEGLSNKIRTTIEKLSDEVQHHNLTVPLFQKFTMRVIELCENSDPVKQAADPCEKLFQHFVCFKQYK